MPNSASHPTLSLYYPQILTLRGYILSKLPASSKSRRRKFVSIKDHACTRSNLVNTIKANHEGCTQSSHDGDFDEEADLAKLLDRTLVCVRPHEPRLAWQTREKEFQVFSQRNDDADESSLLEGNTPQSETSQSGCSSIAFIVNPTGQCICFAMAIREEMPPCATTIMERS
ncbi:MAG: hypothetical protein Q9172_002717 [Xanthocarpia lactea]